MIICTRLNKIVNRRFEFLNTMDEKINKDFATEDRRVDEKLNLIFKDCNEDDTMYNICKMIKIRDDMCGGKK